MIGSYLGRAIDNRGAEFQHDGVGKSLENDFISYAVRISLRDSHANLSFLFHVVMIMGLMGLMGLMG